MHRFMQEAFKFGLQVNVNKTKYVQMNSEVKISVEVNWQNYFYERVNRFCYFGAVTDRCDMKEKIKARTIKDNKAAGTLHIFLTGKMLSHKAYHQPWGMVVKHGQ